MLALKNVIDELPQISVKAIIVNAYASCRKHRDIQ